MARVRDEDLAISVADNGAGMPPEVLEKVFEPLFSTKAFGVGLGLPLVKRIVEQHGGSITVSSEPGLGTKFEMIFPAVVDQWDRAS